MNTIKKHLLINIPILLVALLLCGCGVTENSAPPSKAEVERAVAAEVSGEEVVIDRVEHLDQIPKEDIYYFKSQDRDLEFQVESFVRASDIGIGVKPVLIYQKGTSVNYWKAIKEYYQPYMDDIFSDATKDGIRYRYHFRDYDELIPIMEKVKLAEVCYSDEMKYHDDAEWYKNHTVTSVDIRWDSGEINEDGRPVTVPLFATGFLIYANANPEETYNKISSAYAGKILSEVIPADDKLPSEFLEKGHKEKLTNVIINGTEMTDELSFMMSFAPSVVLDGVFYAEYDYEYNCYMMRVDPGCGNKSSRCHPLQAIVKAAGGTGGDKCNNGNKEEWDINGDHFVITADRDMGVSYIKGVTLTKNGEPMDITYTNRNDRIRSSDMVFVSVDDIAKMLELTVTIDEANDTVIFEK